MDLQSFQPLRGTDPRHSTHGDGPFDRARPAAETGLSFVKMHNSFAVVCLDYVTFYSRVRTFYTNLDAKCRKTVQ